MSSHRLFTFCVHDFCAESFCLKLTNRVVMRGENVEGHPQLLFKGENRQGRVIGWVWGMLETGLLLRYLGGPWCLHQIEDFRAEQDWEQGDDLHLSMVRTRKGYSSVGHPRGNICLWFISGSGAHAEVGWGCRSWFVSQQQTSRWEHQRLSDLPKFAGWSSGRARSRNRVRKILFVYLGQKCHFYL